MTEASRCSLHHWQGGAPNVVEVNLFNNSIGDEGCIALADALAAPSSALRTLYLERNAIGDRGTAALGTALDRNTALETLGLLGNEMTDTGRVALARFVGSGLPTPGARDEYQRRGAAKPAMRMSASHRQEAQLPSKASVARASSPPPPAPSPPPEDVPPGCLAMCGRATCWEMQGIGQHCEDVELLCGNACAGCCTATLPPAPPPVPPALPPCVDSVRR